MSRTTPFEDLYNIMIDADEKLALIQHYSECKVARSEAAEIRRKFHEALGFDPGTVVIAEQG
jgi:hypothetical protein